MRSREGFEILHGEGNLDTRLKDFSGGNLPTRSGALRYLNLTFDELP